MSVAPEIAILAEASLLVPAQPARTAERPRQAGTRPTLGTLARHLRMLAASPERWWGLVRFDPDRSVRIEIEDQPEYGAWLVVLPPAHAGQQSAGQDCDCDVATVIAGEVTEGGPAAAVLRPGSTRVHGQRHRLRGHGARVLDQPARPRRPRPSSGLSQSPVGTQQIVSSQFIEPQCRSNRLNGSRGHFPTCRQRGLISDD